MLCNGVRVGYYCLAGLFARRIRLATSPPSPPPGGLRICVNRLKMWTVPIINCPKHAAPTIQIQYSNIKYIAKICQQNKINYHRESNGGYR
jgi:hypothetical protein